MLKNAYDQSTKEMGELLDASEDVVKTKIKRMGEDLSS